jgi:hypothetical protein
MRCEKQILIVKKTLKYLYVSAMVGGTQSG